MGRELRARSAAKRPAATDPKATEKPEQLLITHPRKVYWPEQGYTKGDLLDYYARVSPALLAFLKDRPVILVRYPDGIAGKSFFQKDAPVFAPDWIRTETVYSDDDGIVVVA